MVLLSKLEARFHSAGHANVKFFVATRNATNTARMRNVSRQLEVLTVNDTQSNQFSTLEDRSVYVFDRCGRIVYVIHYPYSSVQKPFVKAAILSTIYDQPCGYCPTAVSTDGEMVSQGREMKETNRISLFLFKDQEDISEVDETAETITAIDPNLTSSQSSGQANVQSGNEATSRIDMLTKLQEQMQSTHRPNTEQMTVTPTFANEHSRNTNEIFKFNPSIHTGIDDLGGIGGGIDSASDAPYVIPLKILLPVDHVHKSKANNSFVRYNYILLKVDDVSYHKHIPSDNSEILFPVDSGHTSSATDMRTSPPDSDNEHEATTLVAVTENVFDIAGNEHTANSIQNDIVLVDSQGYRYELSHHIKILNEFETNVVEFDSIAMVRETADTKPNANKVTKRILSDDDVQQIDDEKSDLNVTQYERHYAKIFQWLHYHL